MANLKEKYTDPLSPVRQADNSFNISQNLAFKDHKALVLGWPKNFFSFLSERHIFDFHQELC